jgi:DNA-binding transcriptional LysR family regulator
MPLGRDKRYIFVGLINIVDHSSMLKELRTFLAVTRYGTFSRTAEKVGLTQSAVSAQIRRLEESLGFPLFDRRGRLAVLNAAGRHTLANAGQLLKLFETLHHVPGAEEDHDARLDVGAVASVQSVVMPAALADLHKTLPHLRVRVLPGVSLALMGEVHAGVLDAAVMFRPPFAAPAELVWRPLWNEPFVLLAPAEERSRDWRMLLRQRPFVRYDRASMGGRLITQFLQAEGIVPRDVFEMDELAGIVQLVARGLGVALVPRSLPSFPLPPEVRVIGLGRAGFHREVGMLERARHGRMATVKALVHALRQAAAGNKA